MKLSSYFEGLLSNIEPGPTAVKKAQKAHEELRTIIREDEELSNADPDTYLSGSYARDTALNSIKDVDVIMVITLDHNATRPDVAIAWLLACLQKYYDKARAQGRSVQVTAGNGVDLDVVLAVPLSHRAGPVWIPDRDAQQWVATYPKGQIAFGVEKNDKTDGYYKRLVKILKYWRDRLASETARANSYLLESLVAESLVVTPKSYGHGVVTIFQAIYSNYFSYLSLNVVPRVTDPGYPSVNVAKRWQFNEFSAFMSEIKASLVTATAALESEDYSESARLWRNLFGTKFKPKE